MPSRDYTRGRRELEGGSVAGRPEKLRASRVLSLRARPRRETISGMAEGRTITSPPFRGQFFHGGRGSMKRRLLAVAALLGVAIAVSTLTTPVRAEYIIIIANAGQRAEVPKQQ